MRTIKNPTFMQAIVLRDHKRLAELVAAGQHPLIHIERCIEMREDAIETLMRHVRHDDVSVKIVEGVVRHLEMIDRYPFALEVLNDWLDGI